VIFLTTSARPEPVEGRFGETCAVSCFDKLSTNGLCSA
jgi:hypothetical protein